MSAYAILSQEPCGEQTKYTVILRADDGYQETQQYVGDEKTLVEAATSFNEAWMAQKKESQEIADIDTQVEEPKFVEV